MVSTSTKCLAMIKEKKKKRSKGKERKPIRESTKDFELTETKKKTEEKA